MGAIGAISIVAYILASVIAFFSLLDFVNATLEWFGERVGLVAPDYPILTFQVMYKGLYYLDTQLNPSLTYTSIYVSKSLKDNRKEVNQ